MNSFSRKLIALLLLPACVWAKPPKSPPADAELAPPPPPPATIVFRETRYEGRVSDDEARFVAEFMMESLGKQGAEQALFEGDLAILPPKLPDELRLERAGNQYRLFV